MRKYIFGESVEIIDNKLEFVLTENELPSSEIQNDDQQLDEIQVEEIIIVIIIAILSTTYEFFEDKKTGLFYEIIVGKFPTMEYDDRYGASACATPPLNIMIFPLQWVVIFPCWPDNWLRNYNWFLCLLVYLPLSVILTAIFLVICTICVPFSYLITCARLIARAKNEKESSGNNPL